jgi:hypothetical protein
MAHARMIPARRALASALLVFLMSTTVAVPEAEARRFLFPILGAPFRAVGRIASWRANSPFAFPILGAPFRAVGRIRQNSPFAFPILGAPFRFLAGGPVFAQQAEPEGLPTPVSGTLPQ